jgi:hypothetical protein
MNALGSLCRESCPTMITAGELLKGVEQGLTGLALSALRQILEQRGLRREQGLAPVSV